MAELNTSKPFGIDEVALNKIDWKLALKRVIHDQRSDFIYAPHLNFIYRKAGDELVEVVRRDLKNGQYSPGVPITIEVPKPFRIRVKVKSKRLGPSYSRPGSILLPRDRILYQALADEAAPIVKNRTDTTRSFSHVLAAYDEPSMFLPTRHCWNQLQKALSQYAKSKTDRYVLKVDIANFFGSLNQHTLINELGDAGYPSGLSSRLEAMLVRYTGDRSSRGILQGMHPSDLLGNYYLAPVDRFLSERGMPSARYVDDIYIFLKSVDSADPLVRDLVPLLRSYDLVMNEAKSALIPKSSLFTEEPDLEALFAAAVDEVAEQLKEEEFDADYGFQSEWDDDDDEDGDDDTDLELEATKILFASVSDYPGNEENIERFCLPIFATAQSDYALEHVIAAFKKRPAMAQIYSSYLATFIEQQSVRGFLTALLSQEDLADWQKIWILAALSQVGRPDDDSVREATRILQDQRRHEALRGVAAIFVGRFGDHARRKMLVSSYPSLSMYVQAAIYYSSRRWPKVERNNARANWSGHSPLHNLLTVALERA